MTRVDKTPAGGPEKGKKKAGSLKPPAFMDLRL
jgi:hypothetical protein